MNSSLCSSVPLFARGYREAGRRQRGIGGVMEREGESERAREGRKGRKKGKGDRQIDGGHVGKKKN